MTIRKIEAGRVITKNIDTFVGIAGTIFYDELTGELRLSDGETPGGISIGGPGGGARGYTGSRGSTGTQGRAGYTGSEGAIGYTGSIGTPGGLGYTGSAGLPGSSGSVGYTGSKGSGISVSETQPSDPIAGDLWYSDTDGRLYVYYDNFWVDSNPSTPGYTGSEGAVGYTGSEGAVGYTGSASTLTVATSSTLGGVKIGNNLSITEDGILSATSSVILSDNPPLDPTVGTLWYDTVSGRLYTWFDNNWIDTSPQTAIVPATTSTLGGVKIGAGIDISIDGTISVNTGTQGSGNGYTGSTGTQGVQGYTGSTGTQGVIGYTGSTGTIGYTGSEGSIGYTGSTGTQGEIGYTGSASTVAGYTGSTGTQGEIGYTGSTGTQGVTGYTGSTGTQGEIGYTGSTGTQGVTGYTGSQGKQGVSNNIFYYKANANSYSGYPADGKLLWDNAVQTSATNIVVSHLSENNVDIDIYLLLIQQTQQFIIQDRNDSGNYQTWYVNDVPINTNTGTVSSYWTIPVTLIDSRGVGDIPGFSDDHELILGVISGTKGDIGYTGSIGIGYTGSTGTQGITGYTGSTGTQGEIGYTGSSSNITISEINAASSLTNTVTNVTAIRFDKDTGFSVTDLGSGEVKISLGSSFKTWKVDGQQDLIAFGEDTIRLVAGNGVILTTDPNAAIKTLTISAEAGAASGSSVIKTFNILNEFTAPLLGKSIYIPDASTTIKSVQLVNGMGAVGMDLMVGLYRNNELLNFFTIPAGNIAKKYADLNYFITSSDYITVNVVSGQGGNFSMVLFNA